MSNIDIKSTSPGPALPFEAPEFAILQIDPAAPEEIAKPIDAADRCATLQSVQKDDLGVWLERFRDAGIQANRRTSPDLIAQLTQSIKRPIDTVLCSILDSDPTVCLGAALA